MEKKLIKYFRLLFLLAAGIAAAGWTACSYFASGDQPRRILLIQSYRDDCTWGKELYRGVADCFRKHRIDAEISTFYLDCELLLSDQEIAALTALMNDCEKDAPDLIIVCDDQATFSLLATRHPLTYRIPIVFCGVDYPNYEQLAGHTNVTGFTTEPDFRKCYELIRRIYPEIPFLTVYTNTSYLGKKAIERMNTQLAYTADSLSLFIKDKEKQDSVLLQINNYDQASGLRLMWSTNHGKFHPCISPVWDNFFSGLIRHFPYPTFSVNNEGFGNGYLGGYMTPSYEQTYTAAERGIEMLRGKRGCEIPVTPSKQIPVFDWKEMQRFQVLPGQLPEGSRIDFIPFTVKYRMEIIMLVTLSIFLVCTFTGLLIYLYREEKKSKLRAQKQLLIHRDKLKTVMKSIREGVISIDTEMNIFTINPPALRWLRLEGSEENYLQRNILSLVNISIPGKKNYLKKMIRSVIDKHRNTSFEYATQLTSLDKHWTFPVAGELSGIYENGKLYGMVITFHDTTEEFTQKEFLALTLGSGNISSWRYDFQNRRIIFDKSFFHLFNVENDGSHSILLGDFIRMIHPDDKKKWNDLYEKITSGTLTQHTLQLRIDFNGMGYKWWENRLTYQPPTAPGAYPTVFGLCLSIQKFKQAEEELEQTRRKAQQSDKLKSAFLANMSHEIRTPLNAIVGFSNLLTGEDEFEPEEKQLFIETIQNNCNLLLALLTDILDLARIESETMSFKEEICDINEMIGQIVTSQQVIIPARLQLLQEVPETTVWLRTDRLRLTQVITNLINNAVKFTEKGYVKVGYTRGNDGFLHFFVEDTGKGIPEKDIDRVFLRFFKKDDMAQGAGLGLSICKMIIDHFKGDISVTSQVGKGSRFTVKIPYVEPQPVTGRPTAKKNIQLTRNKMETTSNETAQNKRINILIAEDEESNYLLLKTILQKRCNLYRARTGLEAIDIFNRSPVDMILMDIKMPEMNGIDTVYEIRKVSKEIPIIMQSAYVFDSDMEKAEAAGASGFITKPINVKLLKETILKYFPFVEW